jgi:PAS domain S-box-containing protein
MAEEPLNGLDLQKAMELFEQTTATLKRSYDNLQEELRELREKLERKDRELDDSLAERDRLASNLEHLLESVPSGVVAVDPKGRITRLNRAAHEITGLPTSSQGEKFWDAFPLQNRRRGDDAQLEGLSEASHSAIAIVKEEGEKVLLDLSVSPFLGDEGEVLGRVVVFDDVTRLKRLEEQQHRNQRLVSMGEMAAGIAHEIRNPLGSLELFASHLVEEVRGGPYEELAEQVLKGIRNLSRISGNLLLYARKIEPDRRPTEVRELLEQTLIYARAAVAAKDVKLDAKITDCRVDADPDLLRQAVLNLILNAVQAVEEGGNIRLSCKVDASETPPMVKILVADDGPGVAKEDRERIFDPFYTTRASGVGLGLAIVQRIKSIKLLVADDDADMRMALSLTLKKAGFVCTMAKDGQEALDLMKAGSFEMLITDLRMPRLGGLELLERMSAAAPHTPALVITAHGTVDAAVESMKMGAVDFLQKPFGPEILIEKVKAILATAKPPDTGGVERVKATMIASDPAMEEVLELVDAASASRATVLITGESGTGKEVVARSIHQLSPWNDKPFVAVNCAAIPANLMESELFGHERGAFTGASESREGRFEQAQGGTLLLDEVSEMEPALQAKLLRVLQEREVERVGGKKTIKLDVRVIATTNRDLQEEVRKGNFREDLYYRLHVIPVEIPPLRKRSGDIPQLAEHFLSQSAAPLEGQLPSMSEEAMNALTGHDWPGNVRELQNAVERAVVLSRGGHITARHLKIDGGMRTGEETGGFEISGTLEEMEKKIILAAFEQQGRNKKATARALGINIKTLRARLTSYGIDEPRGDDG